MSDFCFSAFLKQRAEGGHFESVFYIVKFFLSLFPVGVGGQIFQHLFCRMG